MNRTAAAVLIQLILLTTLPQPRTAAAPPPASDFTSAVDGRPLSTVRVVTTDFFVPGYGMYATGRPYWAVGYLGTRAMAAYFLLYSINRYQFTKSVAAAAAQRQASEGGETLRFQWPGTDEYYTANELRRKKGPAALWIVFAVTLNVVTAGISAAHTWTAVEAHNKKFLPSFKVDGYQSGTLSFTYRF